MTTMLLDRPISILTHDYHATASPSSWQDQAITAYQRTAPITLAADFVARVEHLTGRLVSPEAVHVDAPARLVQVVVEGVIFRLQAGDLVVMRPCAHCGGNLLASPVIANQADLGYALAVWEPYDPDCEPEDPRAW